MQEGIEPEAPLNPQAFAVRPIDIVSSEQDFLKLYDENRTMALAMSGPVS
jgi:hypothetical protein